MTLFLVLDGWEIIFHANEVSLRVTQSSRASRAKSMLISIGCGGS